VRQYSQDPLDQSRTDTVSKKRQPSEREKGGGIAGDVGWFHSGGPLEPDFFKGAKELKPGETGGPVETIYGYHLIKMIEIKSPQAVTYQQCRDKVERAFIENEIQTRSTKWMNELSANAVLRTEPTLLWPPMAERASVVPDAGAGKNAEAIADPPAGSVNETIIKRSEVWRELLRADSDDSLNRLIHYEMITSMLKTMGAERMDWECADPRQRSAQAPPSKPIQVSSEIVDVELNDDRLRKEREAPDISFKDYIYLYYGQSVDEYRKKLEAGLLLRVSVRRKVILASRQKHVAVENSDHIDDKTLITEYALAKENYFEPVSYDLSHILIVPTGGMAKADKTAMLGAMTIADQVRRNYVVNPVADNWTKLVQDFSMDTAVNKQRGGRLGSTYPDMRNPEFPEGPALYSEVKTQGVQRGQASAPIRTFRGFHIVLVDGVHPSRQLEFNEVKWRVEKDYLQERAKMYMDVWLRGLTSSAKIKRFIFSTVLTGEQAHGQPQDNFALPKN